MFCVDHAGDSQIDFDKIVNGALIGKWFVDHRLTTVAIFVGGCRGFFRGQGFGCFRLTFFFHLLHVLFFDSFHHVFKFGDRCSSQRCFGLVPMCDGFTQ